MGSALGAGGGADMLQEIIRQKATEAYQRQSLANDAQRNEMEQQRIAEGQKLRGDQLAQAAENSKFLNEQRAAATAAREAATAEHTARQAEIDRLMSDPTVPDATRRWMRGANAGMNQLTVHDYEAPDVHQAHVSADGQRKLDDALTQHKAIRDYDNAHPTPARLTGAKILQDDPTLPLGTQRYLAEIAQKHGGDQAAAQAELAAYLGNPQTQTDHPRLSPVKASKALHSLYTGAASGNPLDGMIADAMRGSGGAGAGAQSVGTPRPPAAVAPDAQLTQRAAEALHQNGYAATPENVQKFLSDPSNRQRLGGGQ